MGNPFCRCNATCRTTRFPVILILCPRNVASIRALRPCRFPFDLRLHNLSPDDGQKLVGNHPLVPLFEGLANFLGRDGAMLVAPASSKKAVTHHVVGKQKKEECQDSDKQDLSNPRPHGPSFSRRRSIRISFHQAASATREREKHCPQRLRPRPTGQR
jgi:hypothetical protein